MNRSMLKYWKRILLFSMALVSGFTFVASQSSTDLNWPAQKKEHLPGTYWWWMGSAVDRENLTYNLESLRTAGIANVHINARNHESNS